jgi:hypothetical protein
VWLGGGATLSYDRLVVTVGSTIRAGAIERYDEAAMQVMPVEGVRANADAAATVGEHAGRRTVRNGCAARSVSMPARAIRTGVPDRRLFQAI